MTDEIVPHDENKLIAERREKLHALRTKGIAFPNDFHPDAFAGDLQAEFDGGNVDGELVMNGVSYQFDAKPVTGAAGMYTAALDGARASWVVREDGSAIGVQINGAVLDAVDVQQLNDAQFRAQVRNKRQLQQAQQITRLSNGGMSSKINGQDVTPTLVTGSFRLG